MTEPMDMYYTTKRQKRESLWFFFGRQYRFGCRKFKSWVLLEFLKLSPETVESVVVLIWKGIRRRLVTFALDWFIP